MHELRERIFFAAFIFMPPGRVLALNGYTWKVLMKAIAALIIAASTSIPGLLA
jgi:hypothetical protein